MDAEWWRSVAGGIVRIACLTGLVAMFAASVAMLGRSTAAALGVAFAYLLIFENLLRAWKPWAGRFLVGENGAIFVSGADLDDRDLHAGRPTTAGLTLARLRHRDGASSPSRPSGAATWRRPS